MRRKGQFVSMIAVVALLFISGGSIFTAMFAQETFGSRVDYYTRDTGHVLESKVVGSLYNYTVKKEMNFTENNVAWKMRKPDNSGRYQWSEGSIRDYSSLKSNYTDKIVNGQVGLDELDFVDGCSEPSLSMDSVTRDQIKIEIEGEKKIRCGYKDSYTEAYFGTNTNEKTLKVRNVKNRWLRIAEASVDLSEGISNGEFPRKIPEGESTTGTGLECKNPDFDYDNPPENSDWSGVTAEDTVKGYAKSEANDKFINDNSNVAENVFQSFDKNGHSWIQADTNTSYPEWEYYTGVRITEREMDSCHAEECTVDQFYDWERETCDKDNDGDINWSTGSEEHSCMDATSKSANFSQCDVNQLSGDKNGTTLTAEATYRPDYVNLKYNLYDNNKKIRTKNGKKRAKLKFKYTYDLN